MVIFNSYVKLPEGIQEIQILRCLSHVIPIIILIDSLPLMASRKDSHGTRGAASGPVSESCHPPDIIPFLGLWLQKLNMG
jgi:hypothetical protein